MGGPTWKSGRPYPPALNCRFAGAAAESGKLVRRENRPKDSREAMVARWYEEGHSQCSVR